MRPESYAEQDGCHNCAVVFVKYEYDEGQRYFCTCGAPPRPPCLSVAMKHHKTEDGRHEHYFDENWYESRRRICGVKERDELNAGIEKMYDEWDEWKDGRRVEPWGKCNSWEDANPISMKERITNDLVRLDETRDRVNKGLMRYKEPAEPVAEEDWEANK